MLLLDGSAIGCTGADPLQHLQQTHVQASPAGAVREYTLPAAQILLGQGGAVFWRKRRIVNTLALKTYVHAVLQADDALDFIGRSKTPLE